MNTIDILSRFGVALFIGLLVGLERGWHSRESEEGSRIAGMRTFALISVMGAVVYRLADTLGAVFFGFAFASLTILLMAAHAMTSYRKAEYGITTTVAALLTFALGATAMRGDIAIASTIAVLASILLGIKPVLHSWIQRLEQKELYAIFQMLLISVVLLPILPDRGYGPWQTLNPYQIWWMVVLISSVSLIGYFALRIAGPRRGLGLTAVLGGLVSSTAVTLSYAHIGRVNASLSRILTAGISLAAGTLFVRTLLIASIIKIELLQHLIGPLGVMTAICYAAAAWYWYRSEPQPGVTKPSIENPFELKAALQFGGLLAVISVLARLFQEHFGERGVFFLAALSGIGDVDPVTLSLSRMAGKEISLSVAEIGIFIALVANTILKGLLTLFIARGKLARGVGWVFCVAIVVGLFVLFMQAG